MKIDFSCYMIEPELSHLSSESLASRRDTDQPEELSKPDLPLRRTSAPLHCAAQVGMTNVARNPGSRLAVTKYLNESFS